jgi:hypothetical protein
MDRTVLAETVNATQTFDNSGSPISLSVSNCLATMMDA